MSLFLEIPEDAIKRTNKCRQRFGCLKGNRFEICPVSKYTRQEGLLLSGVYRHKCPYNQSLGCITKCLCPVRYEIWKKYGR